ncbi:hypothetical protein VTK73DRAFT_4476 [Phialemonium thermophilum]|uniref:AB hydrolase-1 domain-containing protein n=1 Tax=Phialemonium thermophilum TaxID=223376 RepID=A0ABR3WTQ1_9PEZI
MAPEKLKPDDPRVEHRTAQINGKTYYYLLGLPPGVTSPVATVLLIHGWPDLAFGWRYQVPFLLSLGMRVIVPDMIGYGRTDAPANDLRAYSFRSISKDMAALVRHVLPDDPNPSVVVGGHDWGGFLVWRLALWQPTLVRAVFSVCTPYAPPLPEWLEPEAYVARIPNFRYQLQLASGEVERYLRPGDESRLRSFFNGIFLGRNSSGEGIFRTDRGLVFENFDSVGPSPIVGPEEIDFYVREYSHGRSSSEKKDKQPDTDESDSPLHGPLNWYRTRRINYEDDQELLRQGRTRITVPSLFISARGDVALPPAMSAGMEQYFDQLYRAEVNAAHWALWMTPDEVNSHIGAFLGKVVGHGSVKASM